MLPARRESRLRLKWHDRQLQLLFTRANEILFGGASEGGKSTGLRLNFITFCSYIDNLQAFIYRKFYNDAVTNHMTGPTSFPELLRPWVKDKLVKIGENWIEFQETGALITMQQLRTEDDLEKAQGIEKHLLAFDESTQLKRKHIEGVRAWCRMPYEMKDKLYDQIGHLFPHCTPEECKDLFPRIIHTANPIGASVGYFRRQFVHVSAQLPSTPQLAFPIWRADDKDGGFLRQYIPSLITDNPSADPVAQKRRLSSFGEAVAKSLITGAWDIPSGDYFKEWDEERHVVPDFIPPPHLFKFRTFDWGMSDPFATLWWCVATGEEITAKDGSKFTVPAGSLLAYREWVGCDPDKPEKGIYMRNHDIAAGIVARTPEATSGITLSDGWPFSDRGSSNNAAPSKKHTIADVFAENGCPLMRANLARIQGWAQMRDRLIGRNGVALIYFTTSCQYAREYIPALPYHDTNPEDAAESGESTHICDIIRYACAARPLASHIPKKEGIALPNRSATLTPRQIIQNIRPNKLSITSR